MCTNTATDHCTGPSDHCSGRNVYTSAFQRLSATVHFPLWHQYLPEPDFPPYLDSAAGGFNLLGELAGWNSAERSSDRARSRRNSVVKSRDTRLLSRREFNERCVALSSLVTLSGALALDAATAVALTGAARTVKFRDGTIVPAIGQGSCHIRQRRPPASHTEQTSRTRLPPRITLLH